MSDPLWEKYYGWTPWHYSRNNPLWAVDYNGLDEKQRVQAIKFAESYIGSGSTYILGEKKLPGKPVDCSGLVNNSVISAGEPSLVGRDGVTGTGVQQIEKVSKKIENFDDVQEGNIITFRTGGWGFHTGIISKIILDENGKPKSFEYIHSSSTNKGPGKNIIDVNNKKIHGIYKWDTVPDTNTEPKTTEPEIETRTSPSSGEFFKVE